MYALGKSVYHLPPWVVRLYQRHQFSRAIHKSYQQWMQHFPRWVNAGFDEYFLLNDAMPLLTGIMAGEQSCDPGDLARKWASVYRISDERAERAVAECTPVAANFISLLQIEYATLQNHFQPIPAVSLNN